MIYGERLRLRAPEKEDLPLFVTWLNDPEVREGLALFLPMSMAKEEKWFGDMLTRPDISQPLTIEVSNRDTWVPIGNLSLFDFDHNARSAELGIMIGDKNYWNQGYGTEAVSLLIRHGFNTLNLHRIFLRVFENNGKAIRCYEKAGFIQEGILRQGYYSKGHYIDVYLMSILRAEWEVMDK